jgi:hypothetical protein
MALRAEYEAGDLMVTVPPLLGLDVVNVAGRRWVGPSRRSRVHLPPTGVTRVGETAIGGITS